MDITITNLFLLNAFALILIGLFGIVTRINLIKILLSINILQTGVNLLLVGLGYFEDANAPIITAKLNSLSNFTDPLPQALVLTSIVIAFGTTALGLAISVNFFKKNRSINLDRSNPLDKREDVE